ncbi:hypothetical protein ACU01S_002551 [Yersinia enterocolitica]
MKEIDALEAAFIKAGKAFSKALQDVGLLLEKHKKPDLISIPRPEPIEPWRQKGRKPWRRRR